MYSRMAKLLCLVLFFFSLELEVLLKNEDALHLNQYSIPFCFSNATF